MQIKLAAQRRQQVLHFLHGELFFCHPKQDVFFYRQAWEKQRFRALEENAAIVSACNLQQIADFSNIHPSSLVFAGGGSKGKLWSQILADVSGLPVNIPVVKEATALGCAIAAGVGAGIFSSMAETGERLVRWERTHTPDPEKHELYQDSRDKWQAVYQDQLGLVDHGLTTSLWKAPGL